MPNSLKPAVPTDSVNWSRGGTSVVTSTGNADVAVDAATPTPREIAVDAGLSPQASFPKGTRTLPTALSRVIT